MSSMTTRKTGTVRVHPRGFGFFMPDDDAGGSGAFITPPDLNPFLEGDRAEAVVSASADGRFTASDLRLVHRHRTKLFGNVVSHRGQPHLRIDREVANRDWPLDPEGAPGAAEERTFVLARIVGDHLVTERVLDTSCDVAIEGILVRHAIPQTYPNDVLREALEADDGPAGIERRDLRSHPTITIDAASSRDLDDAICVLPADADGAVRLLVSIADVSSTVRAGTSLDAEARRRGTSVYLPDRVLPMLPPALSEERLSLLPGVERNCLTVELRITPEGEILSTDIYRSVIRSWSRLTYDEAAAFLDRGELAPEHESLREMLTWSRTAWARLSTSRRSRGGVELAREEARVGIDENTGRATVLEALEPTSAHEMIERFMVAANEAVARWIEARGVPAPYRVHDEPDGRAVAQLASIARNFGFSPGFGPSLSPLALAALERQIRHAPAAPTILAVLGKALGPARYTVVPDFHFGLGADRYLHFTSPIRRYADLLVHRAVIAYLDGKRPTDPRPEELETACAAINALARRAAKAETQARRALGARYIASRLGEVFDAHVIGVTHVGLRVQLRGTLVVGWVASDSMRDGPYEFRAGNQELANSTTTFGIGMPVRVRAARADELLGTVDFELAE